LSGFSNLNLIGIGAEPKIHRNVYGKKLCQANLWLNIDQAAFAEVALTVLSKSAGHERVRCDFAIPTMRKNDDLNGTISPHTAHAGCSSDL